MAEQANNTICAEKGHDALYIVNRYTEIGRIRHQITPCKRCGKGEKELEAWEKERGFKE